MNTLQKLIILFFGLTIITSVIGLSMFYIEKPYIGKSDCTDQLNNSVFTTSLPAQIKGCSYEAPKEASPFMESIINSSVLFGITFLLLSGIAFYQRPKQPLPPK